MHSWSHLSADINVTTTLTPPKRHLYHSGTYHSVSHLSRESNVRQILFYQTTKNTLIFHLFTITICEKMLQMPYINIYQSPLILTELFQHNLINVSYLTACYLYQVMMTLHFLNDVANDAESTQK